MTDFTLPFWIVSEREHVLNKPAQIPCADPKAIHAFTDAGKLTAFLDARKGGRWNVDLVSNAKAVLLAVADARDQGNKNFCFDPEPDGSGGTSMSISEVLSNYRSG